MQQWSTVLNIASFGFGSYAAYAWYTASRAPKSDVNGGYFLITDAQGFTPMMREAANRNRIAAATTAVSVALGVVAQLLHAW
jgi:hypothetical protein